MLSEHDRTPHRFRRRPKTARYRARVAMRPGGPGAELMNHLGASAALFTLRPGDLGLSSDLEQPSTLYHHADMQTIREAVASTFAGPVYYAVEVGEGEATERRGRLHVHIVAHRDDGPPHIRRNSERHKPVSDLRGLLEYLGKPPERYSPEAETDHKAAVILSDHRRAPQTRGFLRSASRTAWATAQHPEPNALSATFSLTNLPIAIWEGAYSLPVPKHGAHGRGPDLAPRLPSTGAVVRGLRGLQRLDRRAPRRPANTTAWKASGGPPALAPPSTGRAVQGKRTRKVPEITR